MELLRNIIATVLIFFYEIVGDYGLAIILLTVSVKLITLPLHVKQMQSTKAMQEIAPLQKELQEKYKDDKEKLNQATMELYKEKKINPLGGCLPLLVQFPVLIAIFGVLRAPEVMEAVPGFSSYFLGMIDLNTPDMLFGVVPGVIPILAGITTYIQTKQTTAGQAGGTEGPMGMMTKIMPLMIVFFSYSLPAGLPLYWLVGNIFSIGQHHFMNRAKAVPEIVNP